MALRKLNPTTAGQRNVVLVDRSQLHKGKPYKKLTVGLSRTGGRNNKGHNTSINTGGRHKRLYRLVDFKRQKFNIPGLVERIEYDPNRTAYIALISYEDGEKAYILAPQKLEIGQKVVSAEKADIKVGNAMKLKNMPIGTLVHNIELSPAAGGTVARSAGAYAQLIGKEVGHVQLKLASGELRLVNSECFATIGALSNADNRNIKLGKAGRNRWLGKRPHVRGTAMNPVDHPLGGGEGRNFGKHPVSRTGKGLRGKKTRTNKRTNNFILRTRHQAKKK